MKRRAVTAIAARPIPTNATTVSISSQILFNTVAVVVSAVLSVLLFGARMWLWLWLEGVVMAVGTDAAHLVQQAVQGELHFRT